MNGQGLDLHPSFLRALRGVWLLTWRTQFTWRRSPLMIINLLILPALVYLTTWSMQTWAKRQTPAGNPAVELNTLTRRLARANHPLTLQQNKVLFRIFAEEFTRADVLNDDDSTKPNAAADSQNERIKACHERILQRVRPELDEAQVPIFRSFEQRRFETSLANARQPNWGRTGPFYHWLIDLYFFVLLPLTCVRTCGALIREELQADTLGFLVTRPVKRAALLVTKYLSQTAWWQILMAIEALLLFVAGSLRQIPSLGSLIPLFLAAQFLAVLAWSALGTFLGLVTKRYMAMAMVYGLIVEMGIGRIPTNINTLSLMRHLKSLLSRNPTLQGIYDWPARGIPVSVGALLAATAIFLTLAALLFTFKEYHHTTEMQK